MQRNISQSFAHVYSFRDCRFGLAGPSKMAGPFLFSNVLNANSSVRFMKHLRNFYVFMSEETV